MAEVRWTLQALDDLEVICLFIARDAPPVAAVFAQRAFDATDRLAEFPRSGRTVPELNNPDFREIILGNYRLTEFDPGMFRFLRYTTLPGR